jgi:hypothetical protein
MAASGCGVAPAWECVAAGALTQVNRIDRAGHALARFDADLIQIRVGARADA